MEHTIMDSLGLTIVAMSLVFLILSGLMVLMQITAKLVNKADGGVKEKVSKSSPDAKSTMVQPNAELERVALLTALAEASENKQGKHYQVEKIERIK